MENQQGQKDWTRWRRGVLETDVQVRDAAVRLPTMQDILHRVGKQAQQLRTPRSLVDRFTKPKRSEVEML